MRLQKSVFIIFGVIAFVLVGLTTNFVSNLIQIQELSSRTKIIIWTAFIVSVILLIFCQLYYERTLAASSNHEGKLSRKERLSLNNKVEKLLDDWYVLLNSTEDLKIETIKGGELPTDEDSFEFFLKGKLYHNVDQYMISHGCKFVLDFNTLKEHTENELRFLADNSKIQNSHKTIESTSLHLSQWFPAHNKAIEQAEFQVNTIIGALENIKKGIGVK